MSVYYKKQPRYTRAKIEQKRIELSSPDCLVSNEHKDFILSVMESFFVEDSEEPP